MEKDKRLNDWMYQSIGFLAVITLCWLCELFQLPTLVLGDHSFLSRATIETLLILAVWLIVSTSTRRVLQHMRRLEGFMKLCAWCHRVEHHGNWMRLEDYLQQGFDTPTSHGICEICLAREKARAEEVRNARKRAQAEHSPAPAPDSVRG
jgi:hypothetical protein